jgi:hypothetical protein
VTISIAELTEKFGPALDVPGVGMCLAISDSEFNPDWVALLSDQGFTVLFETWDNHPMTVVPLHVSGNVVVKDVESNKNKWNMHDPEVMWKPAEEAFLAELWNQQPKLTTGVIAEKYAEKFPKRKASAVGPRITVLQKKGVIASRWKLKPKASKEAERSPETPKVTVGASAVYGRFVEPEPKGGIVSKPTLALIGENNSETVIPLSELNKDGALKETLIKITVEPADPVKSQDDVIEEIAKNIEKYVDRRQEPLEKKLQVLSEAYDSQSKAYVELKTELEKLKTFVLDSVYVPLSMNIDAIKELKPQLVKHKHAVSGEMMLPPGGF